ncbi:PHD finger protein 10-like [Halichondria panicea]|uniref:PHD finger protein 10-like n=1 Tax=Halichondria panicea TaxID=6063 RepID=UPI00312BB567
MGDSSGEEFTPPPSKRQVRSDSREDDKNDPSYRGNKGSPPPHSVRSDYFPASQLFEYQWPLGNTTADYFMLQEQVKEFLDIRGIQRKYPDWRRRALEVEEREFLVGMSVVSETLSNMGLVALQSEEVLESMATDYPYKYSEYVQVLKEKEFQQTLRNKMIEARRMAAVTAQLESDDVARADVRSGALRMVGQFNQQLARQRETLTKGYIDPHTKLHHFPRSPTKLRPVPVKTRYPAALLPGQYSDNYPIFTSQELSQLPLNTVSGVPEYMAKKIQAQPQAGNSLGVQANPNPGVPNSTVVKAAADDLLKILKSSKSKSQPSTPVGEGRQVSLLNSIQKLLTAYATGSRTGAKPMSVESSKQTSVSSTRRSSLSELLKGGESGMGSSSEQASKATNKDGSSEIRVEEKDQSGIELLEDAKEKNRGIIQGTVSEMLNSDQANVDTKPERTATIEKPSNKSKKPNMRTALCSVCRKGRGSNMKGVAEDLVQCSQCFTFAHPTCYNLPSTILSVLKLYDWQCLECKTCQVCKSPHEEDKMVFCDDCDRGYHSFCVGLDEVPSGNWLCPLCGRCGSCDKDKAGPTAESKWKHEYIEGRFIHTLCVECSSYFRQGCYCPVCYKVYKDDHTDSPMVCCDSCDRWIHTGCDGISVQEYEKLSEENSNYMCIKCRNK